MPQRLKYPPRAGVTRPARPASTTRMIHTAGLPWFPFLSEGIHVKLCRANLSTGELMLMIRIEPGAGMGLHYQHGVVAAYTVKGRWRYRDAAWTAGPGDVISTPAGSTHEFENVGEEPVEAFVHLTGAIEFKDERGKTLCIENAETLHGRYLAYCALHGIAPVEVVSR